MLNPTEWVPMRWPADWQPDALQLLDKTAINCIVIDGAQIASSAPLLERARKQGISVVTIGGAGSANVPAVPSATVAKMDEVKSGDVLALVEVGWPRIPMPKAGAEGGPTGLPWVDTNGWISLLARAKLPGKAFWMDVAPPKDAPDLRSEQYVLAVADAAAYGSRWVISLDPKLKAGLEKKEERAQAMWQDLTAAAAFFEKQKPWRSYQPVASLAVLSDFAGPNEYMGTEVLNLSARRQIQYRVVDKARASAADLRNVKGLLWVDQKAPEGALSQAVKNFVAKGGMLVAAASVAHFADGLPSAGVFDGRYNLFTSGEGRIAIAREPWDDPYQVAADAQLLLSRKNDVLRMWNSGTVNAYYSAGANGKAVVQILNFATRFWGNPVSLYISHPYKKVKWSTLPAAVPEEAAVSRKGPGIEIEVPPFESYGAIELGD